MPTWAELVLFLATLPYNQRAQACHLGATWASRYWASWGEDWPMARELVPRLNVAAEAFQIAEVEMDALARSYERLGRAALDCVDSSDRADIRDLILTHELR